MDRAAPGRDTCQQHWAFPTSCLTYQSTMGRGLRLDSSSVTSCVTFGKLLHFSRLTDSYLIGL